MAIAGKVAITLATENDGKWSADIYYERLVAVTHNNNMYISRKQSIGVEPPNNEFWFSALGGYSGDELTDILSGKKQVGNARTLDGKGVSYFAKDSDLIVERERISNLARLNDGITTGDAELADIRVGADGKTYTNAGEAVRCQITDLKSDLIKETERRGYSLAEYTETGYVESDGSINSESLARNTGFVYIKGFNKIEASASLNNSSYVIALYDNNKNFLSSVSVRGAGIGNKMYEVDLTDSKYVNAVYAVASSYLHYEESTFLAYNSLSPYGNEEKKSSVMYDYPNGFELKGFWNASGAFEGNENVKSSSLLDVRGYSVLRAVGCLNNSGYVVALFDKDKNIIPGLSVLGNAVLSAKEVTIDLKDVAYSSVCYASVAVYYYDLYIDSCYIECVSEKFVEENASELFGKSFNVLGDSISSVDYVNPNWWQMIANKTFARFNNYAVSGTPIARGNRANSFVERVSDLDVNADGVIVMGGTNDGDTYKGAWDSTDDTTFYGALNYLLTQLSTNFSGKPILFCTPIQPKTGYGENTNNPLETLNAKSENEKLTPQERAEAIKLKCKQYGIPCVDLYNESGLNGVTGVYYIDDLHPSQTGHERMSSLIRSKLEEVFR